MSQKRILPSFEGLLAYLLQLQKAAYNASVQALLNSIPIIGPGLASNKRIATYLETLFISDDEIQNDIQKIAQYMSEVEEVMDRLNIRIEQRTGDLTKTLEEYERYKELASVEREKALPIIKEVSREGNKGIIWGVITNGIMVIFGIILAHYLRIWFPGFNF